MELHQAKIGQTITYISFGKKTKGKIEKIVPTDQKELKVRAIDNRYRSGLVAVMVRNATLNDD